MAKKNNLMMAGASIAKRNGRYIFWFYLLNVFLAWSGAVAFKVQAESVMDHSLYADKVLHGFDLVTLIELISRPEFGPLNSAVMPAVYFGILFCLLNFVFMPGVLAGYAATGRLTREDFFRACGRNLWRFVRLLLFFILIGGAVFGILSGTRVGLAKAADTTSNERLPFFVQITGLAITLLVMTAIRAWFDLAEAEVVVQDQGIVRRTVAAGFHSMRRSLGRLVGTYVLIRVISLIAIALGLWIWLVAVPPDSVLAAFVVGQLIAFVTLAARFWQRACGVEFFLGSLAVPAVEPVSVPSVSVPPVPMVEGGAQI